MAYQQIKEICCESFNSKSYASSRKSQNNKYWVEAKHASSQNIEFKSKEFISTESEGSDHNDKDSFAYQ